MVPERLAVSLDDAICLDLDRGYAARGVLIAGGASARMGTDKRTLRTATGETLLERAHERLSAVIDDVAWLVEPGFPLEAPCGVSLVEDRRTGTGPLEALTDFAGDSGVSWLLALGTDMPNLSVRILSHLLLLSRALPDPGWALVPSFLERDQPLAAVYGVEFLATVGRGPQGPRSFRQVLSGPDAKVMRVGPSALGIDPSSWITVFWNVNRPEEWQQWRCRHRET